MLMGAASSHDGSVHVHSRARLVSVVIAARWDFSDLQKSTRRDSKEQSHLPEGSYCAGSVLYT